MLGSREMRSGSKPISGAVALVCVLHLGCLPPDTRPEPGSVRVTASPAAATAHGFTTDDGWAISIERLLATLGAIELQGEGCTAYSEPRYTRLFDFAVPVEEPQKIALVYGLGRCDLAFELSAPESSALLGPGVTAADLALMRERAEDVFVDEPRRTSVLVRGEARRGAATKRFEWMFRMEYDIESCASGFDDAGDLLALEAGVALERTIVVDPTELFRESFDAIAGADLDGDDAITLEELDGASAPGGTSFAELLYESLVPRMARPSGTVECDFELDRR